MTPCRPRAAILFAAFALVAPFPLPVHAVDTTEGEMLARPAPLDFGEIVARTASAVVGISTRQIVMPSLPRGLPESLGDRLREHNSELRPHESKAMGSGFFITAEGHIVTNNHVIDSATLIEVMFEDGSKHKADLVGVDPLTDLAVLQIARAEALPEDMVVASWGDSDALRPGAWTIAVGSPFGLGGTVTVGVLSASQRTIEDGPFDDFLQTDAAINVGNSGGPLFNVEGQVVGVNTAIFSPTGASVGIGFAVPSRTAEQVVAALIADGEVRRGSIGTELQDFDAVIARAFGYDEQTGALIAGVEPGGPADAAGLRRGDVVVALGQTPVQSARELSLAVAESEPGETIRIGYLRNGTGTLAETDVEVALLVVPRPELPQIDPPADHPRLGLSLRPVPERLRDELGLDGVLVQRVRPGGLGEINGLRRGDVILEAGNLPVGAPDDVTVAWNAARAADRPLLLQIRRAGAPRYVAIDN